MMNRMKKRISTLALLIAVAILAAACGGGATTTSSVTSAAATTASTAASTAASTPAATVVNEPPQASEPTVIKYATFDNYYANASYADGVPVVQKMEEIMNVKIEWELASSSQYVTTMETRLAANVDLPDIMNLMSVDVTKYGAAGVLANITEYITPEKIPYSYAWFQEHPEFLASITSPDQQVYQLAGYRGRGEVEGDPYGFMIRTDWLDKLGLEKPTTLDEMYDVLVAFRDGDPNGNGQKDEIPFACGQNNYTYFAECFGLTLHTDGHWGVRDGQVYFARTDPAYRDYLAFLNKLYSEKLMDQEFATISADQINSKAAQGLYGLMANWFNMAYAYNKSMITSGLTEANFDTIVPLKQVNGEDGFLLALTILCRPSAFSAKSKVLDEAIRFFDWSVMSDEANVLTNFGIEGKSYTIDASGVYQYTDFALNNPDGLSPMEALRSLGCWPTFAYSFINDSRWAMNITNPQAYALTPEMRKYVKDSIVFAPASDEMSNTFNTYMNDIQTYTNEMMMRFIDGSASIEKEWDSYVAAIESMGIGEVLPVMQQRYDIANN